MKINGKGTGGLYILINASCLNAFSFCHIFIINKTCICGLDAAECPRLLSRGDSEFAVEKILNHNFQRDQRWYFIKWKGFDAVCNQWVEEVELFGKFLVKLHFRMSKDLKSIYDIS